MKKSEFQQFLFHEHATDQDVSKIEKRIRKDFDLTDIENRRQLDSLPEALISSIFSINVRPMAWKNVLRNFQEYAGLGDLSPKDRRNFGLKDLLGLGKNYREFETEIFINSQRTSTKRGITKAEAVIKVANILVEEGINNFNDLDEEKLIRIYRKFRNVSGQRNGVTFIFMLILCGWNDLVKPDRRIQDYCQMVLDKRVPPTYAAEVVRQAAYRLGLKPGNLDLLLFRSETE